MRFSCLSSPCLSDMMISYLMHLRFRLDSPTNMSRWVSQVSQRFHHQLHCLQGVAARTAERVVTAGSASQPVSFRASSLQHQLHAAPDVIPRASGTLLDQHQIQPMSAQNLLASTAEDRRDSAVNLPRPHSQLVSCSAVFAPASAKLKSNGRVVHNLSPTVTLM